MSLLYGCDTNAAVWVLGGKNVPRERVQAAFLRDGVLSPDTCGWNYVEGLRDDDSPQIAIAWDTVIGLGHNGERRPGLMHEVVLLDGSTEYVGTNQWPTFVADERQELKEIIASRSRDAPAIRWSDEEALGPNLRNKK